MSQQWYKIVREDDSVQYACTYKDGGEYYMYGSGFGIVAFNHVKEVTKVDSIPDEFEVGYAYMDFEFTGVFRCLHNKHTWWNGWACPYIFFEEKERLIKFVSVDPYEVKVEGDKIILHDTNDGDYREGDLVLEPTIVMGKKVYSTYMMGWTWSYHSHQQNDQFMWQLMSPDGMSIEHDGGIYKGHYQAAMALDKWVGRYKQQGYYSSARYGRIQVEDIVQHCRQNVVDLEEFDVDEENENEVGICSVCGKVCLPDVDCYEDGETGESLCDAHAEFNEEKDYYTKKK